MSKTKLEARMLYAVERHHASADNTAAQIALSTIAAGSETAGKDALLRGTDRKIVAALRAAGWGPLTPPPEARAAIDRLSRYVIWREALDKGADATIERSPYADGETELLDDLQVALTVFAIR